MIENIYSSLYTKDEIYVEIINNGNGTDKVWCLRFLSFDTSEPLAFSQ